MRFMEQASKVRVVGTVRVLGRRGWDDGYTLADGTVCDVISPDQGERACPGSLWVRDPQGRTAILGSELYAVMS